MILSPSKTCVPKEVSPVEKKSQVNMKAISSGAKRACVFLNTKGDYLIRLNQGGLVRREPKIIK